MMHSFITVLLAASFAVAQPAATFPSASGSVTLKAPQKVTGTFDCGMKRYGRGLGCSDEDGGPEGAVFILEGGAKLKNCIIGKDQKEGVHCNGPCTIENVWWEAVCEDALSILGSGTSTINGGGARGARDKVIQHNGRGTVKINNFYVDTFGKLYRSCGNCKGNGGPRHVIIDGVRAAGGKVIAGVNSNYGDTATIKNVCGADPKGMCQVYKGCDKAKGSCESSKTSTGFNGGACKDGGNNRAKC